MNKLIIPKTVRVGAIDYDVDYADVVVIDGSINYAGSCDFENSQILIIDKLKESKKFAVFMHELVHIMFDQAGYHEHDEDMVERLARVLHQILRDNYFYEDESDIVEEQDGQSSD
jgi:Zn-dependent peptidase ImmA (M78 family)